ncbi:hypothetical protein Trydic_g10450 [Trypoxylus dichotomus]
MNTLRLLTKADTTNATLRFTSTACIDVMPRLPHFNLLVQKVMLATITELLSSSEPELMYDTGLKTYLNMPTALVHLILSRKDLHVIIGILTAHCRLRKRSFETERTNDLLNKGHHAHNVTLTLCPVQSSTRGTILGKEQLSAVRAVLLGTIPTYIKIVT